MSTIREAYVAQTVFRRNEVKYLIDREQRARFLHVASQHLTGDEYGPSTVRNVYFDTPTLLLARRSEEHPTYKEKIRARCYGAYSAGDPVFVELKKKYRGVVYKRRAELSPARAAELLRGCGHPQTQIERELDFTVRRYEGLAPQVFLAYDREAYVSPEDGALRVTLDARVRARTDRLSLSGGDDGVLLLEPGVSVLEVKCLEGMPLWLVHFLTEEGLRKTRVSKYGLAYTRLLADAVPKAVTSSQLNATPSVTAPAETRWEPKHLAKGGIYA